MYHQTYTQYNDKKTVEALDLNRYDPFRATIFPYGVYSGAILPVDDYTCGQAREIPSPTTSSIAREHNIQIIFLGSGTLGRSTAM